MGTELNKEFSTEEYCEETYWGTVLSGSSLTLTKDKGLSRNLTLGHNKEVGYDRSKSQARFWAWTRKQAQVFWSSLKQLSLK